MCVHNFTHIACEVTIFLIQKGIEFYEIAVSIITEMRKLILVSIRLNCYGCGLELPIMQSSLFYQFFIKN